MSTITAVPVKQIRVVKGFNARDVDAKGDDIQALAKSIAEVGVRVPLIVTETEKGYDLVAGHRRLAAAKIAKLEDVPVVVRDGSASAMDAAVENIARRQLTVYEEAMALDAALKEGLTEAGAATVLGWSARRVTERKRILDLPKDAQPLIGVGLRPECIDLLLDLHAKCPALYEKAVAAVNPDAERPATLETLRDWVARYASNNAQEVGAWRLGRQRMSMMPADTPVELTDRWRALGGEHEWEEWRARFTDDQADRAQAMGCLVDLGTLHGDRDGLIVSAELVIEFITEVVTIEENDRATAAEYAAAERKERSATPRTPDKELELQERRDRRELMPVARQVNEDLARLMLDGLADVEVTKDVALFFSRAVLGDWYTASSFTPESQKRTQALARAVALAVPELRHVHAQQGTKGKTAPAKVTYAEDGDAAAWLRKFVEGGKTPGQILGRTLVVHAIARNVLEEAVGTGEAAKRRWLPQSTIPTDALRALDKIAKPHLPGSLRGLRSEQTKRRKAREDAYAMATAKPIPASDPGEAGDSK